MGRTGKLKKKSTSIHSRAARRGNSPSDVDKSLQSMPRVEAPMKSSSVLAAQANAGISKKKQKDKKLSRAQRLRQQKGIERAETVIDQLETKVAKSVGKSKTVHARKGQWEDLNSKQAKAMKILQTTQEEMEEDEEPSSAAPIISTKATFAAPIENSLPPAENQVMDDDDNIT